MLQRTPLKDWQSLTVQTNWGTLIQGLVNTNIKKKLQGASWVAVQRGVKLVFLMPSLSFTEGSVNSITTKEMEVKSFLAILKDTSTQNMKARDSLGESVLPF